MGMDPSNALQLIIENEGSIGSHYAMSDKVLGKGAFGVVTKAELIATKAVRAVKTILKKKTKHSQELLKREIRVMKKVDHPNLVMLYEIFEDENNIYLVLEMCAGGDLHKKLLKAGVFTEMQAATVMKQILRGIFYLHKNSICHRDMKAQNVLLATLGPIEKCLLKVSDKNGDGKVSISELATGK